jgi:lipoate-protein ligase A
VVVDDLELGAEKRLEISWTCEFPADTTGSGSIFLDDVSLVIVDYAPATSATTTTTAEASTTTTAAAATTTTAITKLPYDGQALTNNDFEIQTSDSIQDWKLSGGAQPGAGYA